VKGTYRKSRMKRRGRGRGKNKVVRFFSQGHFQRTCTLSPHPHVKGNVKFSSWKSLFFYRCTDTILFAPLKSQGIDSRLKHIREKTVEAAPPPCSPKSIYILASLVRDPQPGASHTTLTWKFQLGIHPLRDNAFADIKGKVSSDNVVHEVFSWVTAR